MVGEVEGGGRNEYFALNERFVTARKYRERGGE